MEVSLKTYNRVFKDLSDPRVYKWPLLSGPWGFLAIVSIYFYTILYWLPSFMKYRRAYNLKIVIAIYNIFQMVACSFLVYGVLTSGWTTYYTLGCQPVDYSESEMALRMANYMWWHMILKMVEFLETIFFILRKKSSQVSTLHVYHHVSTFYFAWFTAKYVSGGMITFTVVINSTVHIIMYAYYLLSSFGPKMQKRLAELKPKITKIQVIQLVIILLHTLQALSSTCNIPKIVPYTYLPNILINILLFINFYKGSYEKQKMKRQYCN